MKYLFLSAYRNEAPIIDTFLDEFAAMLRETGLTDRAVLYLVDDLSFDDTRARIEAFRARADAPRIEVIPTPANLGNQGAMAYGLARIEAGPGDVLVTFDCDGEDDVRAIPSILELGRQHPGKAVFIERGRRAESVVFKVAFAVYKAIFRFLTQKKVVPNNFLLVPGTMVDAVRGAPLVAVHFAYGILKLDPPHVSTTRDRRARYGGSTSQNLLTLVSHGLVGLMVFYEVVVAKIFMLVFALAVTVGALVLAGLTLPAGGVGQARLQWLALAVGVAGFILCGLLLSAALAFVFKVGLYAFAASGRPPGPGGKAGVEE